MKSIDLFCTSPASTAICSTIDHRPSAITRHNIHHRLGGGVTPRFRPNNAPPCSSHLPFDPSRPFRKPQPDTLRRKSSADVEDLSRPSSRYLLSEKPFFDIVHDPERGLVSSQAYTRRLNLDEYHARFRSLSTNSSTSYESPVFKPQSDKHYQVVELWVSIHCKGCEGKLRKHISRMEGVKSFSIDLGRKKVTVKGEVTREEVLTSISKVKNAQFWPSPATTSSSSSSSTT